MAGEVMPIRTNAIPPFLPVPPSRFALRRASPPNLTNLPYPPY